MAKVGDSGHEYQADDGFVIKAKKQQFEGFTKDEEGVWQGPFCFIQAADTQFGMMESYIEKKPVVTNWDKEIELTRTAIVAANKLKPRPRFFIVCGDLIDAMPGDRNQDPQTRDFKKVFSDLHSDIPLVCVCGNHDIGNTPTRESIQRYRDNYGDDYFSFWVGGVKFIVINSQYYEDPSLVMEMRDEHEQWLDKELEDAKSSKCQHLVIFQHIPWFLRHPDEEKEYFNIEIETRKRMLEKFKAVAVRTIFCGHYHRNAGGFDGDMELVVTSAVGAQLGDDGHGFRIVKVTEDKISHKYHNLHCVPEKVSFS